MKIFIKRDRLKMFNYMIKSYSGYIVGDWIILRDVDRHYLIAQITGFDNNLGLVFWKTPVSKDKNIESSSFIEDIEDFKSYSFRITNY